MDGLKIILMGGLATLMVAEVACSEGGFGDQSSGPTTVDTGVAETGGDTGTDDAAGDTSESETGVEPDTADAGTDDPDTGISETAPVEAFSSCSAGGISTGNGITAVQCFGPVELSGRRATGGGVTWQSGAFRVISEGVK